LWKAEQAAGYGPPGIHGGEDRERINGKRMTMSRYLLVSTGWGRPVKGHSGHPSSNIAVSGFDGNWYAG